MIGPEVSRAVEILLVEDEPADARLTREALRDARVINEIHVVPDGTEAMQYLRREGPYASAKRPDLVILDLNLPGKDGREVLEEIKADQDLRQIPVVVLSTSSAESDIAKAYEYQASCYIVKPVDADKYFHAIRTLKELWFNIVALPATAAAGGAPGMRRRDTYF